jgi:hypothetical protein
MVLLGKDRNIRIGVRVLRHNCIEEKKTKKGLALGLHAGEQI